MLVIISMPLVGTLVDCLIRVVTTASVLVASRESAPTQQIALIPTSATLVERCDAVQGSITIWDKGGSPFKN